MRHFGRLFAFWRQGTPEDGPPHDPLPEEVTILSATDADRNSKLFRWRDDLYRGLFPRNAKLYRRLLESGFLDRLTDLGLLIRTRPTDLKLEPFEFIVQHERIPFVTYPFEWCPPMLKDAALTILRLQEELTREGLELFDAHAWNLIFDGTHPVFVDLGSIVQIDHPGVWRAWHEFCRYLLYPLLLASAGEATLARTLLRDFRNAVPEALIERMCPQLDEYLSHRRLLLQQTDLDGRLRFLDALRRDLESIPIQRTTTEWSEYYGDTFTALDPSPEWRAKQRTFWEVISRLKPKSVVDIGSNRGLYAQMAARRSISVAAFDADQSAVGAMYEDARRLHLPLTPVVMDLLDPSPALGLCNAWFPSAHDRLNAELALASAMVHHMVFKMNLNFGQIADALLKFARKWLLVEYIPREDRFVREWCSEDYAWYTTDNFVQELRKRCSRLEILPSDPAPRLFVLCQLHPGSHK